MEQTVPITRENFSEYEQKVCQMERQQRKKEAERKCPDIVGGFAFFIAALSAVYYLFDQSEIPIIPQLSFLVGLWEKLCTAILPEDCSYEHLVLFSLLASAVIFVAVHLLTVLPVKLACSGGPAAPPAPLEGSDAERAAALYTRCQAVGTGYSSRRRLIHIFLSAVYVVILFIPLFMPIFQSDFDRDAFLNLIDTSGMKFITTGGIFLLIYAIFNAVLGGFLYRIRQDPDLENDLRAYSELCKKQEQEQERAEEERRRIEAEEKRRRIKAEEKRRRIEAEEKRRRIKAEKKRRRAEKAEQDRQRGDELYRQATAGGAVDEALVRQAADLGSRPACLYMGRQLLEKWATGSYTKAEKLEIAGEAQKYFDTASSEKDSVEAKTEARFGYLMCWTMDKHSSDWTLNEHISESKWSDVLSELREIQKSGKLPEQYSETCATLIDSVVDMIDTLAEERASRVYAATVSTGTWSTSDTGSSSSYTDRYKLYEELDTMEAIMERMRLAEMSGETPGDAYMD